MHRLLDESPRWLYSRGRYAEAEAIVKKMLKKNGKSHAIPEQGFTPEQLGQALGASSNTNMDGTNVMDRKYGIVDLFKTPRLRYRIINIAFNW